MLKSTVMYTKVKSTLGNLSSTCDTHANLSRKDRFILVQSNTQWLKIKMKASTQPKWKYVFSEFPCTPFCNLKLTFGIYDKIKKLQRHI